MIKEIWVIIKEFINTLFELDFRSRSAPVLFLLKSSIVSLIWINFYELMFQNYNVEIIKVIIKDEINGK